MKLDAVCIPLARTPYTSNEEEATYLPYNVIPLAKEFVPIVQHSLLLIVQIIPIGHALVCFQRGRGERAGWVLARKD